MGVHVAHRVAAGLIACGKPAATPVAVVENVSLPDERMRFTTLGELTNGAYRPSTPAIILFGPQFSRRRARIATARAADLSRVALRPVAALLE